MAPVLIALIRALEDVDVIALDYLYASSLTVAPQNYWDPVHFTSAVARVVEDDIAALLGGREPESEFVRRIDGDSVRTPLQ